MRSAFSALACVSHESLSSMSARVSGSSFDDELGYAADVRGAYGRGLEHGGVESGLSLGDFACVARCRAGDGAAVAVPYVLVGFRMYGVGLCRF